MKNKVTSEIIEQMQVLYEKLGKYSAVAKETGFSASTVSKYLKEASKSLQIESDIVAKEMDEIDLSSINCNALLEDERQNLNNFVKEYFK